MVYGLGFRVEGVAILAQGFRLRAFRFGFSRAFSDGGRRSC